MVEDGGSGVGRHSVCLQDLFESKRPSSFGENPAERKQGFLGCFLSPVPSAARFFLANGATDSAGGLCPKVLPLRLVVFWVCGKGRQGPKATCFWIRTLPPWCDWRSCWRLLVRDATCHSRHSSLASIACRNFSLNSRRMVNIWLVQRISDGKGNDVCAAKDCESLCGYWQSFFVVLTSVQAQDRVKVKGLITHAYGGNHCFADN